MIVNLVGMAQNIDYALCQHSGLFGPFWPNLQDREFIPTKSRDSVELAHACAQTYTNLAQQDVTHWVAECIVHRLEVIEIQKQYCRFNRTAGLCDGRLNLLAKYHPVWQVGQRIVSRSESHLRLCHTPGGDVRESGQPAPATRQKPAAHLDDAAVRQFTFACRLWEPARAEPCYSLCQTRQPCDGIDTRTRRHQVLRQVEKFHRTRVAYRHSSFRVDHHEPLIHRCQRGLQLMGCGGKTCLTRLQFVGSLAQLRILPLQKIELSVQRMA